MKIEEILKRKAEIEARLSAIDAECDSCQDTSKIEELRNEAKALVEERGKLLIDEQAAKDEEARQALAAQSNPLEPKGGTEMEQEMTKREKLNLVTGLCARKMMPTDEQKRALGKALTTTATSYVAATSEVDGVNNGGVLIPTDLILDFLKEEKKLSPILNDIAFTNVKGLVVYPYRESRTAGNHKAEGSGTGKNQFKLNKLELVKGFLQIVIDVTDEVEALSEIDFGAYIIDNITNDLSEDWAYDFIYGAGSDDAVKGLTVGALTTGISSYVAGKEIEALEKGLKLLPGKYRRGAKVYVSQSFYDALAFAKNDDGDYKFPIINGGVGVVSICGHRVEIDENLVDGDFVIGNVAKYYKANLLAPLSVEKERDAIKHVSSYVASQFCAAAPFPGAFVHGSKASS